MHETRLWPIFTEAVQVKYTRPLVISHVHNLKSWKKNNLKQLIHFAK